MQTLSFPDRITVELTNDCNVSCVFCNRQKVEMKIGYMNENLFCKIIDEAAEHLPVKLVPFFRGEPLMHPQVIEFITYAKKKGIGPIQMASNALLLDEKMQDDLIEAGVDYISFSLDTIDEEIYSRSRLTGNLRISSQNVESFGMKCRERKRHGLVAPTIQVSTIDLKEYKTTQQEFIDKWKQYADVVRVYEQHDEKGKLVNPEVQKKLSVLESRMPCRKVFTDMIIYWDGRLALCNYDWNEKRELGNVNTMSLADAWNSSEYKTVREMHIDNKFDEGICKNCHHWKIDYSESGLLGKIYKVNKKVENK